MTEFTDLSLFLCCTFPGNSLPLALWHRILSFSFKSLLILRGKLLSWTQLNDLKREIGPMFAKEPSWLCFPCWKSLHLILQLLPPLRGRVLRGSERLWRGAESLSLLLMLWEAGWRGRAQHLPGCDPGDSLGNTLGARCFWKEGSGPSAEAHERISLAEPHQARPKAPSALIKRGAAEGKGKKWQIKANVEAPSSPC